MCDWRAGVFSCAAIMQAMSKHLTLRDIEELFSTCKWNGWWRSTMSSALHMRERAQLRWPHALRDFATCDEVFATLQNRAAWALKKRQQGDPCTVWECWISQCSVSMYVGTAELVDQQLMPYTTCTGCFYNAFYRHTQYAYNTYFFYLDCIRRHVTGDVTINAMRAFLREYKLGFLITESFQRTWLNSKRKPMIRLFNRTATIIKQYSTADMDAVAAKHAVEYDLVAKWARYQAGERIPRPVKKRRNTLDEDDEEWIE